jgi:hypothetical protein
MSALQVLGALLIAAPFVAIAVVSNHHRCTYYTDHQQDHRCQHCTHTWETSGGDR